MNVCARGLFLGAIVLLAATALNAQDSRENYLRQFDRNGDGKVSVAEYVAYMSRGFDRMDRNGDGVISRDELPGGRGQPITLKAFQRNLRNQFRKLDRNRDGYLDARELTAPPR
ncbi:MAG TPA: EF-hand domain-containing protein [Rhodanobacter sp.]|nr:EF-hand domain-containing protein [Rhodanobacter sp.]